MINNNFGTVILARIPYSDLTQVKKRPALIISSQSYYERYGDVLLIGLTGQKKPSPFKTDIQIHDWQIAGLPKSSFIKPGLFTLMHNQIEREFGQLSAQDKNNIQTFLREMLSL